MQSTLLLALLIASSVGAAPASAEGQAPRERPAAQAPEGAGVTAELVRVERDEDGKLTGLMLRDGTRVMLRAQAEPALLPMLHPGDRLRVQGELSEEGGTRVISPIRITNLTTNQALVLAVTPPAPKAAEVQVPEGATKVAIKGRLKEFWPGARGEADGLYLIEGTEVIWPSAFGPNIRRAVAIGEPVRIVGFYVTNDWGRRQFRALSLVNEKTHQRIDLPATASMGGGAGAPER